MLWVLHPKLLNQLAVLQFEPLDILDCFVEHAVNAIATILKGHYDALFELDGSFDLGNWEVLVKNIVFGFGSTCPNGVMQATFTLSDCLKFHRQQNRCLLRVECGLILAVLAGCPSTGVFQSVTRPQTILANPFSALVEGSSGWSGGWSH